MTLRQRTAIPASQLRAFEYALIDAHRTNPMSLAVEFTGNGKSGREGGGCSNHCPFCAVSAPKGPTHFMPWELIDSIAKTAAKILQRHPWSQVTSHFRSDFFDYSFEGKNALNIWMLFQYAGLRLSVVTAVPKGSESLVAEAIRRRWSMDLSFHLANEDRLLSNDALMGALVSRGVIVKKIETAVAFCLADEKKPADSRYALDLERGFHERTGMSGNTGYLAPVPVRSEGKTRYAYFMRLFGIERDSVAHRVPGIQCFWELVRTNQLRQDQPFLMEHLRVPLQDRYSDISIRNRSWNLSLIGRAFDGSEAGSISIVIEQSCPKLLIDSLGGIYRVDAVPLSWENREGMVFTQIRPPFIRPNEPNEAEHL